MAGAGYKLFNTGDVLTAAQVNTYLMEQTIMVFANAAARDTALSGVVAQGMQCFLKDTNTMQYYSGSAWVTLSTGGDITSVVAGTGISGGGTSGDVTITNSMATAIDAKGDLVAGTANDTFARLAVGNNGETLVADSSASTGLRWNPSPTLANPVINGGFDIWQRGTSLTASLGQVPYLADRWCGYSGSATGRTITRQATNDTTNLPFIQYCARIARDSGNSATNGISLSQSVETINAIPFAGKTVTLSFYARAGANYSAASNFLESRLFSGTGTDQNNLNAGFTGQVSLINQNNILTTTWQRFTATATVGASATELEIRFIFSPTGTAGANDYFEVTGVQLDLGSVALPFRRSGGTIAGELAACMRYFQRAIVAGNTNERLSTGQAISTTAAEITHRFPVVMRGNPTLTVSSASHFFLITSTGGAAGAPTSISGGILTPNMARVDCSGSSSLTAGNATTLQSSSASSTLDFSAEL